MRGRPAGQTVRRTVFGGRAFSPPPYGRLRRPALRAVSLRLAGGCGGQGPVFCGLCRRAAGRKPRQKKPQARNNPRKPGGRQRLCGPQARRLRRRNGRSPFARRWAAGGLRPRRGSCRRVGYSSPCRSSTGRRRLASSAASRILTTSQERKGTTQAEKLAKKGVPERMEYHSVPKK